LPCRNLSATEDSAPALSQAKEKAKEITCYNNLKQIGLASFAYLQDYNDWIMPAGTYKPAHGWYTWINYMKDNNKMSDSMLNCPVANKKDFTFSSYAMNYLLCGNAATASGLLNMHRILYINNPSNAVNYCDSGRTADYTVQKISAQVFPLGFRHGKNASFLYFDGHVDGKKYAELMSVGDTIVFSNH
jgi:prepilin-type processing-associated H-X9-DG protein